MTSAARLVELGERYVALGLPAAARGVLERALAEGGEVASAAARRLAELALVWGDAAGARIYAARVVEADDGPAARVLLGRAYLAAGEHAAARRAFAVVLEGSAAPLQRARAHHGVALAATAAGDGAGAAANAMAAVGEVLDWAAAEARADDEIERELALFEDLAATAVALDRGADVTAQVQALADCWPERPWRLLAAVTMAVLQGHGDAQVGDADIEALLDEEARRRGSRLARLRRVERWLRRRFRDAAARARAVQELEALAAELESTRSTVADAVDLARVCFLLAAAYEDDPGTVGQAEAAYRKGLALRPGHAAAASRLAALALARGEHESALVAIERALRADAGQGAAWRNAARVLEASPHATGAIVARVLDAAEPGAGSAAAAVAPRLLHATTEVARADVLAGMHTRGHRMKNVLGIIGARTRSARKLAQGDLGDRLRELEREVTTLYEEWSTYLRSMQSAGPVIEVVPVAPLVNEVVEAAAARTGAAIHKTVPPGLPDLRGDRMMLREALLNIVSNAAEAAAGRVEVTVRQVAAGGVSVIEIDVADDGPGIPRGDLARVFAPGFTTKESGSGVGLAIAERVVSAHHGRIELDSDPERGTRVTVALPGDLGGFAGLAAFAPEPPPEGP
jgi:signal transduction histidine kinase